MLHGIEVKGEDRSEAEEEEEKDDWEVVADQNQLVHQWKVLQGFQRPLAFVNVGMPLFNRREMLCKLLDSKDLPEP